MNQILQQKAIEFSVQSVTFSKYLMKAKEFVISKQFIRCSTSIGANIFEAFQAESKKDFIHKLCISLKEAKEAEYWLIIIQNTQNEDFKNNLNFQELSNKCQEVIKLLTFIIKKQKFNSQHIK